jgi:hypothetical protein
MSEEAASLQNPLMEGRVVLPQHVVHRRFPNETVVLNLHTGKYHGLNPTAGAILEALAQSGSIALASAELAEGFGREREAVEEDVRELCAALLERDLIEIEDDRE